MDLILWRHAEAEDARDGNDLGRALTARGRDQAERMAAWLAPRLPAATRILASPALRCQQTLEALGRAATTIEAIGPGASPEALLAAAGSPHAARRGPGRRPSADARRECCACGSATTPGAPQGRRVLAAQRPRRSARSRPTPAEAPDDL